MGQHLKTYSSDFQEKPGFILYEKKLTKGRHTVLHWHDFIEFEIIISGQIDHIYNGITYTASAGDAYLMYYNDFHSVYAKTDVLLYSIHFSNHLLAPDLTDWLEFNKFRCRFSSEETARIVQKLKEMTKEAETSPMFSELIIRNLLTDIIIQLIRKSPNEKMHATVPLIRQVVAYINSNFRQDISLDSLSAELSYSSSYIGHLFKAETGLSFNKYLNTLRLKYACNLLTVSDLTIKEIAFSSGYNSVEYFLYIFKKQLGMAPSQYRAIHKGKQLED